MPVRPPSSRRSATWLLLIVVVGLATSCSGGGAASIKGFVRDPPLAVGDVMLPEVAVDGTSQDFALRAAPGELLIAFFGYTHCPDVCPTTLADLRTALGRLGDDATSIDLAFVTVDPDRDTPEVLHGFLGHFSDRYHALRTEDPAELDAAEAALLVTSEVTTNAEGEVEVIHTGTTYVVDDAGQVLVEWPFGTPNTTYSDDLRVLLDRQADR